MNPIFLPKNRTGRPSVTVWVTLIGVLLLGTLLVLGIAWVITDRTLSNSERIPFITGVLIGTLLGFGFMERIRR